MADNVSVVAEKVRAISDAVQGDILTLLQEANVMLPDLREIDQDLYTTVQLKLAAAYTGGVSYMHSSVQGAADCFQEMSDAVSASADKWEETEEQNTNDFK